MQSSVIRHYRVGGLPFSIEFESPWSPMRYSDQVLGRIADAASGKTAIPVLPVRAGDKVPYRTFVQGRGDLAPDWDANMLDLSAIDPFLTRGEEPDVFRLTIHASSEPLVDLGSNEGLLMDVREAEPYFRVVRRPEGTWFGISSKASPSLGALLVSCDHSRGDYYPVPGMPFYKVAFMLDMLARMMFSYNSPKYSALLMHSSVVAVDNEAVMFLGSSGTGKSTHSRLWLENIPGAELVNDDNPVVRLEDGRLFVYGTPWSGKTPCYRNVRVPVKAIVCLKQAPVNEISSLKGVYAYAGFSSAVSLIRWEREIMDDSTRLASQIVMSVPFFAMNCLPDKEAAKICHNGVWR